MRGFKATFLTVLLACCGFGASAADLRIGVASEITTLDPHFFHL
ncbi:MAG: hypothetical protein QOF90_2216, partial [Acetobacteraceae bacterium]|nr:hypothetical protein [Acetobacteraceae bacterium]